ncbi:hypothetical protein CRUP_015290 [Coryphaenoides rupestris]|nr:hypothetical protein CRUP_015290 [Coryphaenoides rupestris]
MVVKNMVIQEPWSSRNIFSRRIHNAAATAASPWTTVHHRCRGDDDTNTVVSYLRGEVFLAYVNQSAAFCGQFNGGRWYCYVLLVLFTFGLPVGLVGNVAALVNYTFFQRPLRTSHVFLLHLALCDSAWILTLPFTIYFNLHRHYLQDIQVYCKLKMVFFNVNIYGSVLFLTLISFDRYAGTVHPISSLQWWDVGRAKLCAALAWLLLFLSSVPDLFMTFAMRPPGNATVCMDYIQGPFAYVWALSITRTVVGFLLPFVVMLVLYGMTLRVLRRMPRGGRRGRGCRGCRGDGAALLVFVVSFVPYHAMIITLVFMRMRGEVTPANTNVLYAAYEFFEAMCSVSCCLDPLLYILASERVQRKLLSLGRGRYGRLCCRGNQRRRRWKMNLPASRPAMMARIQQITFMAFHAPPGYLLNRKEKQLPTTAMWACVWLWDKGSSAKIRKLQKVTSHITPSLPPLTDPTPCGGTLLLVVLLVLLVLMLLKPNSTTAHDGAVVVDPLWRDDYYPWCDLVLLLLLLSLLLLLLLLL